MSWIRLDDQYLDHPKFIGLPNDALLLWHVCLAYCNAQNTNGWLSEGLVGVLAARRHLENVDPAVLVDAGLWEREPGGFRIHDYAVYQLTTAAKDERRLKDAARQARWRASQKRHAVTPGRAGTGPEDDDDLLLDIGSRSSSSSPVTAMSQRDIAVRLADAFHELTGLRANGAVVDDIERLLNDGVEAKFIEEKIAVCARAGAESWNYVAQAIRNDHAPAGRAGPAVNPFAAGAAWMAETRRRAEQHEEPLAEAL